MRLVKKFAALPSWQQKAAPYFTLTIAILIAYAAAWRGEFLFDDILMIVQNQYLHHWSNLPDLLTGSSFSGSGHTLGFHRPVLMLLYFLTFQIFGLSAPAFHGINIALHAANAGLVYRLGCRVGIRRLAAFAGALLWALHPLQTEAVTYISGTEDPLYSFFCLLGLLTLLPDFASRKFWLAGLWFVIALGAKESAAVFPALVTITIFLVSTERQKMMVYLRTWPLWLIAILYITGDLVSMHASHLQMHDPADLDYFQSYAGNIVHRIFTTLATLPVYFSLILWPSHLHMERTFPIFTSPWSWPVLTGVAMVAVGLLQILWGRARRGLALSWGLLWFAITLSPNTGILVPLDSLMYEHWMYFPTVGLALGGSAAVAAGLENRSREVHIVVLSLLTACLFALGVKTFTQNAVWQNAATFYENIFRCGGTSGRAHNNLGEYYATHGDFDQAIAQYRMALARPDMLPQSMIPVIHTNIAIAYLRIQLSDSDTSIQDQLQALIRVLPLAAQIPDAIAELNQALALNPNFFWANKILAVIYAFQGNAAQSAFYESRAAASQPGY